ncbi:hypothetical protein CEUSTIGMA_g8476.t1 [Chlamydomonas eustigma]|uniref:SGNH hydrolase-type esterase domain-containing protein n=1 Tax=Chlamydomonas eustigma TaxID=1157962 RepID=A0A250XD93_9CHLO|nr:hypothetical protein CEUSTIGMA_g8476.t1 [Chlamydomonas eustigma]|eukprot:GAX81041.1 hypothetical protein CEUSTIGMA_g8476.t1 [Chlamydomonas eustigma]
MLLKPNLVLALICIKLLIFASVIHSSRHVLFLGDSTIFRASSNFAGNHKCSITLTRSSRCGDYGLKPAPKRWPPQTCEGPAAFGLKNRGCRDCDGCNGMYLNCSGSSIASFEYIPLEFAVDLTLQTDLYETSQENVFKVYLANRSVDLIVTNSGFHDMEVCKSGQEYEASLRKFLGEISTFATAKSAHVIYLPMTRMMVSLLAPDNPQRSVITNERVQEFNLRADALCKEFGITYLDLHSLSSLIPDKLYSDVVHIGHKNGVYYRWVSQMVWITYALLLKQDHSAADV